MERIEPRRVPDLAMCEGMKERPLRSAAHQLAQQLSALNNRPQRWFYPGVLGLFLFSTVLRLALTLNRELDVDEFEHLHAAWMVSKHYLLYRDFFENHTPLFYYLLQPFFHLLPEGAGLVMLVRIIMSLSAFGILVLTYKLARLDHDKKTSVLAALLLSYMVIFVQKSIEVRPDQLLVILWLASLWIARRALSTDRAINLAPAGALLGLACLLSPKALFPLAAMGITFVVYSRLRKRHALRDFLRWQGYYAAGFVVPVMICAAFFYYAGALREMVTLTLVDNLKYPDIYRPTYLLNLRNICFFLLAAVGLTMRAGLLNKRKPTRDKRLLILLPSILLLSIFLFAEVAPYSQSTLLFAPLLAIYGAEALRKSLDGLGFTPASGEIGTGWWHSRGFKLLFATFTVAAGLIIPAAMILLKARPFVRTNAGQFQRMEYVLRLTRPSDAVFDGESAYVFRPQAYFYGSLIEATLWRLQHGEIPQDIPESLMEADCRVVIYDARVSQLPRSAQLFLQAHYKPSTFPGVYVAATPLSATSRASQ